VEGDGFLDGLYLLFWDVINSEELTGGIRAIDLEAFVPAREFSPETGHPAALTL
jgi:hypothetical protein